MRVRAAATATVAVLLVLTASPAGAVSASVGRNPVIESRVLELVNALRKKHGRAPYAMHAGLRDVAREHARGMATARRLSHDGFEGRLLRATPDPLETNSAPDDGIWGGYTAACENAAYHFRAGSTTETDEQVARNFADGWYASPGHKACLLDSWGYGLNATGIGIYRDAAGVWWAAMEVAYDATPPGGLFRCGVDAPQLSVNACR